MFKNNIYFRKTTKMGSIKIKEEFSNGPEEDDDNIDEIIDELELDES